MHRGVWFRDWCPEARETSLLLQLTLVMMLTRLVTELSVDLFDPHDALQTFVTIIPIFQKKKNETWGGQAAGPSSQQLVIG